MKVRRYESEDFETIKQWGLEYGAHYDIEQFPQTGFIVDGVAAYFLYETDSLCCWLENMIAKKGVPHDIRNEALGLIIEAIIDEAKFLGYKIAYASTNRHQVALRAKKYGAHVQPNNLLLTLNLHETPKGA